MPQSSCFRDIHACVEACRATSNGDEIGLCIADCEVDLLKCLREETGDAGSDSLVSILLSGLLVPAITPTARLPAVTGGESVLKHVEADNTRPVKQVSRWSHMWTQVKQGGEMKGTVETALLLIPLLSGVVAFIWDLVARTFFDRGEAPPQPPCPQCGAGETLQRVGGNIDLITVAFVAIPALFAITLLIRRDLRSAMLRSTTGMTLLVIAALLSIVGLLRGVLIGFTESIRWVM